MMLGRAAPASSARHRSSRQIIKRAREELAASADFASDFTRQDAAILNVERACEAAIDIMNRIVHQRSLGVPASTRDGFDRRVRASIVEPSLAERLMRMVGFRNLAVHQYQKLDIAIVRAVIEKSLDDLLEFSAVALRLPAPN